MKPDENKRRHITVVGRSGMSEVNWDDIQNKPDFAEVATSGEYDDLENKPQLATVATSGSYNDLADKPTILTQWFGTQAEYDAIAVKDPNVIYNIEGSDNVQADWNQSDTTADDYIKNKPTIPAAQVNADWNANSGVAQILNKPTIPTVPTDVSAFNNDAGYLDSTDLKDELVDTYNFFYEDPDTGDLTPNWVDFGSMNGELYNYGILSIDAGTGDYVYEPDYNDLQNKPTIPAAQVNSDWNANSGVAQILNKPTLATVATSGSYNDLSNKPTIPAAQVNSDWNANSGVAQIWNKPNLATVATTGSYNSLKNKPTVPDETETLTFTLQGGTTVTMDVYVKPDYAKTYFFVQDLSGNGGTLTFQAMDGDVNDFDLYTSTDQQTWTLAGRMEMFAHFQVPIPAGGKLYIKATTDRWGDDEWLESDVPYAVGGNLMSILFGDNFENVTALTSVNRKCFNFHGDSNLYDASKLVLPATTLTDACYDNMFNGCHSLTTAPKVLPATTLTAGCYSQMFSGCYTLTDAPALPATTLEGDCYFEMFKDCVALTNAPALPADTLAISCYMGMFMGCNSLVEAPELPAQTLEEQCYFCMFDGCTSLNKMSVYATDISEMDCTTDWLNNVSATGDFANWGGASYTRDASGIPAGWNEIH